MTELGTTYRTSTVAPAPEEPQRSLPGLIARGLGAVAVAAVWLAPYPEGVAADARTTLGVFAVAVWLWVFSKISDTFVALLAASALVLIGVIDVEALFTPLGDDTVWLLIGAFIIAAAVTSSGLAVRVAVYLSAGVTSPRVLVHLLTLAAVCTAFAVPATSGRAALILPVFVALQPVVPAWLSRVLALALPSVVLFSAVASLIGAGAHLITNQILEGADLASFSFTQWMLLGLPLALVSSHLAAEIILRVLSTRAQRGETLRITREALGGASPGPAAGRLSPKETRAVFVLAVAVLLWFTEGVHGIPPAMVAVLGALLITSPYLGTQDLGKTVKKVPWSLLLFMTATIALSHALSVSGAANLLTAWIPAGVPGWVFVLLVIVVSTAAHLVIQSRSARSAVLVPLVVAMAPAAGVSPVAAAFISTAAAGFCHTLPASAKPLAIFLGDEEDPNYNTRDLLKIAAFLAPMHVAVIAVFAFLIWPVLGLPLFM
ncbi:anion transporter [Corynebacterium renale]|uniref:SLC13 family permease n=1 Tax=Corynebacterium renale TaxID=1724 RepID=UPI000DA38540|nr:SLC13 family permease [Corynebacterium renale]SQG63478.1 anion transporter [Corynebacterium renale]STD00304.1 anion transporter [Corynebacterium renale]